MRTWTVIHRFHIHLLQPSVWKSPMDGIHVGSLISTFRSFWPSVHHWNLFIQTTCSSCFFKFYSFTQQSLSPHPFLISQISMKIKVLEMWNIRWSAFNFILCKYFPSIEKNRIWIVTDNFCPSFSQSFKCLKAKSYKPKSDDVIKVMCCFFTIFLLIFKIEDVIRLFFLFHFHLLFKFLYFSLKDT